MNLEVSSTTTEIMKSKLRTALALLTCLSACGYGAYRELQWLAIAGLIGTLCVLYKRQAISVFSAALELVKNTTNAKLGALEIRTEKRLASLAGLLEKPPTWAASILHKLSSEEVGILLTVSKHDKYVPSQASKQQLRTLRNHGLIEHNKPSLEESDIVWCTGLGRDLAQLLTESRLNRTFPEPKDSEQNL